MGTKPTLHRVSQLANVSPATVSRVVAGHPAVAVAIRTRVLRAAAQLGLDLEARRKAKCRTIGFLLANRDVLHAFQARLLLGAEQYCAQHGWQLLFMCFHYAPTTSPDALQVPQLRRELPGVRAMILTGMNHPNLLEMLAGRNIPCAVLGNNLAGPWNPEQCDVVYSDDIRGAYDATRHLAARGHRRISFVGNLALPWFRRCAEGYTKAMTDSALQPHCIDLRSDHTELGYLGAKMLRGGGPHRATAVLAGSDEVACGIYNAFHEDGVLIPDHVSVASINGTDVPLLQPPLTTAREFPEELGRQLAEFALNRLRDPARPAQQVTIPTRLEIRQSVLTLAAEPPASGTSLS